MLTSFLLLPVLADVKKCTGMLQNRCRRRAEGEIPGLGFSVLRLYHGRHCAFSLQKIAMLWG